MQQAERWDGGTSGRYMRSWPGEEVIDVHEVGAKREKINGQRRPRKSYTVGGQRRAMARL